MRLICDSPAEHQHIRKHWRLLRNLLGFRYPITIEVEGSPPVTFPGESSGRDPAR